MQNPAPREIPIAEHPVLRPVAETDDAFLRTLYRSTREAELAGVPWPDAQKAAFCDMQFNAQRDGYRRTFPDAEHVLICAAGGEPAGRFIKARQDGALRLVDIALLPAYRGRGWGSTIIESLQHEAAALNVVLSLSVEKHSPALALYQRLGFSITGDQDFRFTMAWKP